MTATPAPEPYLIAHKVRGEPAFDIAIKMEVETDDEPWWIIPTSGHRAYPFWHYSFRDIFKGTSIVGEAGGWWKGDRILDTVPPCPEDWPDHYTTHAAPGRGVIRNLAEVLGLIPKGTIRRR